MADVKDILGITGIVKSQRDREKEKEKEKERERKKKHGKVKFGREVMGLVGDDLSSLIPTKKPSLAGLKPKRKAARGKWSWKPFENRARDDSLKLSHWERVPPLASHAGPDYVFSKFDIKPQLVEYTDAEYEKYMQDPKWTREQTDALWSHLRDYGLRFIVVADRFPGDRDVEELKGRYYGAAKKILEGRAETEEEKEAAKQHPIVAFPFDEEYERTRKAQYRALAKRTPVQEREEVELIIRLQEIEAKERRLKRDAKLARRQQVKRERAKKQREKRTVQTTARAAAPPPAPGKPVTERPSLDHVKLEEHNYPPLLQLPNRTPKRAGPAILRSTLMQAKLPRPYDSSHGARIEVKFNELGIDHWPVPMPEVVDKYFVLRAEIAELVETEKQLAAVKAQLSGGKAPATPAVGARGAVAGKRLAGSGEAAGAPTNKKPRKVGAASPAPGKPPGGPSK